GAFAEKPRYQGAGSSLINPTRLDTPLEEIRALATGEVAYAPGFSLAADVAESEAAQLRDEAAAAASAAEVVVLFLGLPARLESEGYDRDDIDLPAEQLAVLDAVRAANPNVVVVLSNGGVVALPFARDVPAILEGWLLGQAGGGATADVLFGDVNPSAKLTETIPLRLSDTPAYLDFPGEFGHVRYGEGLFVGYRWYDARNLEVAYPFGHGLSYTTFSHTDAAVRVTDSGDLEVTVTVTNTGQRDGREIVQVYTSLPGSTVQRPVRELKGFASVALTAGQSREVAVTVRRADLAYWDIRVDDWIVEGGEYTVEVGASSRDIRSSVTVAVEGDPVAIPLTRESSLAEAIAHPVVGEMVQGALRQMMATVEGLESVMPEGVSMDRMMMSFPIGRMSMMTGDQVSPEMIDGLIAMANAPQQ
ncbi:MAG TPA: glycosyl hydrolase, partial [Microbacterium sp.]|nr:glycosyl hydrolase [Microbacterium sp.]